MTPNRTKVVVLGQVLPVMSVESSPISFSHNAYAGGKCISKFNQKISLEEAAGGRCLEGLLWLAACPTSSIQSFSILLHQKIFESGTPAGVKKGQGLDNCKYSINAKVPFYLCRWGNPGCCHILVLNLSCLNVNSLGTANFSCRCIISDKSLSRMLNLLLSWIGANCNRNS